MFRIKNSCYLCLLFLLPTLCLQAGTQGSAQKSWSVTVKVLGGTSNQGKAVLSLFDSPDNFLETPSRVLSKKTNAQGVAEFILDDLFDTSYSVSVFFDADDNEELNTNFFGIPSEPVGFSNNAKGRFGPPSFDQTKFNPKDKHSIEIKLITIGD